MTQISQGNLYFIRPDQVQEIRRQILDPKLRSEILSDMFRINVLSMVAEGGGGHIGSSLSCLDIITWLWSEEMENPNEIEKPKADILFSSKGHDVPAFYALLIGFGKLSYDLVHKFRTLRGLAGHPDIATTPQLVTNTGSLGMGISKARGLALGRRLSGKTGRIYVLTGDGELQEGQIWESLQPVINQKLGEITVIVDHNKMQTNALVKNISDLGDLEAKFSAFGWEVTRCDGHNMDELQKVFAHFRTVKDRPQVLIADTIKAKGVSFMESTRPQNQKNYKYHSGVPAPEEYAAAIEEIVNRINQKLQSLGAAVLELDVTAVPERKQFVDVERPVEAYGNELVKIAKQWEEIVVLDADLLPDVGASAFREEFPERFLECGIAEQDMVSVAGGLALSGKLPIVSSYACFLSTRSNEQIYNNATEQKKIIYLAALAGVLPAGPGHSHQCVRDIATISATPGITMIEPCSEAEARLAVRWAVEQNPQSTYLRFCSVTLPLNYELPEDYVLKAGRGVFLNEPVGSAVIIAYGQVMLNEATGAARILRSKGIGVSVVNLPWLNLVDPEWLRELLKFRLIVTLDDHYVAGGQGQMISSALASTGSKLPKILNFGLTQIPACGKNDEVLKFHGLDAGSVAEKIIEKTD